MNGLLVIGCLFIVWGTFILFEVRRMKRRRDHDRQVFYRDCEKRARGVLR